MANKDCNNERQYFKDGKCCDKCPAGKFVKEDCNKTNSTICSSCPEGTFTEDWNNLKQCIKCTKCRATNIQKISNCTTERDTVCECKSGFYSLSEHCEDWTKCPVGEGVKNQPTSKSDTVCAPCGNGTFSNVTDYFSPCKQYTRCDSGQVKTPGTPKADAICHSKSPSGCSWVLPASLWAGFVLTIVVVAAFLLWRTKRRSYRTGNVKMEEIFSKQPAPPELLSHCQDSCGVCISPQPDLDNPGIINVDESLVSSCTICPLQSDCNTSTTQYYTKNFLSFPSEPQEDEWWGFKSSQKKDTD
ncbi:tumor necrosis factor receptor superfamily member 5 [Cyprinodon tularosa]|uniref:tumor necrosis factor receptor superfamily member 5 n=1 Tax=Cyprinodon tularosa TaxID=77115 RepID=UPI0018E24C46|nr:tumor necrosis factor receptor superfamily member 5 [Cyprinodon tularosa]